MTDEQLKAKMVDLEKRLVAFKARWLAKRRK